jgi:hypothetical protein
MGVNISPIPDRDNLDYISLRIYIQDGKLDQVVPEHPWEGQVSLQVVYHDVEFDVLDGEFCSEDECPEGPKLHWSPNKKPGDASHTHGRLTRACILTQR